MHQCEILSGYTCLLRGNFYSATNLQISRTQMYLIDLTSTDNGVKALKDSRVVVDGSTLDPQPFAFSPFFVFSEQVRGDQ